MDTNYMYMYSSKPRHIRLTDEQSHRVNEILAANMKVVDFSNIFNEDYCYGHDSIWGFIPLRRCEYNNLISKSILVDVDIANFEDELLGYLLTGVSSFRDLIPLESLNNLIKNLFNRFYMKPLYVPMEALNARKLHSLYLVDIQYYKRTSDCTITSILPMLHYNGSMVFESRIGDKVFHNWVTIRKRSNKIENMFKYLCPSAVRGVIYSYINDYMFSICGDWSRISHNLLIFFKTHPKCIYTENVLCVPTNEFDSLKELILLLDSEKQEYSIQRSLPIKISTPDFWDMMDFLGTFSKTAAQKWYDGCEYKYTIYTQPRIELNSRELCEKYEPECMKEKFRYLFKDHLHLLPERNKKE